MRAKNTGGILTHLLAFYLLAVPSDPGTKFVDADASVNKDQGEMKLTGLYTGPYFSPTIPANMSVQLGATGQLSCRVRQVGTKTVAWMRVSDGHILTVDTTKFISDDRFMVIKPEDREEWNLIIRNVQPMDEGLYECQISTEPKMSHFVYLNVMVPKVEVEGSPDIFAKSGSTVNLKCTVSGSLSDPPFIFWYHNNQQVKLENWPDANIDVKSIPSGGSSGTLTISHLEPHRSGNYSCQPSNLPEASVHLHVIDAKEQGLRTNHGDLLKPYSVYLCQTSLHLLHLLFQYLLLH